MRKAVLLLLGVLIGVAASTSQAQAQLNRRDRSLLYYNYYQQQQNSRRILQNQQQLRSNVVQFQQAQNQMNRELQDPFERYIRRGPGERVTEPLPRIYSGQAGRGAQYFMRTPYFNTQFPAGR